MAKSDHQTHKSFHNFNQSLAKTPTSYYFWQTSSWKTKGRYYILPMGFGKITINGLIDISALTSAISETDWRKIRLKIPQTILFEGPHTDFLIMVANEHLEMPTAMVELQFKDEDVLFEERVIVITSITTLLKGLLSLQRNSTLLEMRPFLFHATQANRQQIL